FGLGLARYVGWLPFADGRLVSVQRVASWVLLMVAGWTAGYILVRLAAADRSIATFRAREEVARTLHDGVLQTLAVVQRRSDDNDLVELARTQELELREYLFGSDPGQEGGADLAGGLRTVARRAEQRHGLRVEVITAPDLPPGEPRQITAVCGAVGEALTNAAKHGEADRVVVYAEPTDTEIFVSVKDDGAGFEPEAIREGHGLGHSIRGRIDELGGRVDIDGRPGRGAEIRIWT
ncbi:MAG: ATP-binding protein, partial [Actinomycetota bacterium]